jgi:alpha-galactosidase
MNLILENPDLQLEVKPEIARWGVKGQSDLSPLLKDVPICLRYRKGRAVRRLLESWPGASFSGSEVIESPTGPQRQVKILIGAEGDDLFCALTFALPVVGSTLLWRLEIENRCPEPVYVDQIEFLSAGFPDPLRPGPPGVIEFPAGVRPGGREFAFFSNGWQSWSYSGAYGARDRCRITRLGPLTVNKDYNPNTPRPKRAGAFASDMFGVLGERRLRSALLAGFISQREHFGSLESRLRQEAAALRLWANGDGARLDPGRILVTDWACLQFLNLDELDPLGLYFDLVARSHGLEGAAAFPESPVGWCSWYYFSSSDYKGDLKEEDIRKNLEFLRALRPALPADLIQIDDGFESRVGDWYSFSAGFPNGVKPLADEIRAAGFTPGLWLAPFIVHPRSRLASEHPEWLLRGENRRPVNAGYLWGTFTTALDLTQPGALDYAADVVHTAVSEWGFPYLKLDFLYAGALAGQHFDPTKTRAQILRGALEAVRRAAGDGSMLLGCGCPLGSAIGLMDAMRISADTAQRWRPAYRGIELFFGKEPGMPAARNALQNSLTRTGLHRRWWINDPDCLLLRPETWLTLPEIQTIATVIALTGGSLLLSDHMPALPPERLRIAESLLPLIGERPFILDWFDSATPQRARLDLESSMGRWLLLALINWEDRSRDLSLCLRDFRTGVRDELYAREFWSGKSFRISISEGGEPDLVSIRVPAHGTVLFAVRQRQPGQPQYLGSDLHISQGMEVSEWSPGEDALRFSLKRPGKAWGSFELALPGPVVSAISDGRPLPWLELGGGRYLFDIEFDKQAAVEVRYT